MSVIACMYMESYTFMLLMVRSSMLKATHCNVYVWMIICICVELSALVYDILCM